MQRPEEFRQAAGQNAHRVGPLPAVDLSAPDIFRVSPQASAQLLAGVHKAESVHPFTGDHTGFDMKTRLGGTPQSAGRRAIFAWRDPADKLNGALISVQTTLTRGMPDNLQRILMAQDVVAGQPDTAAFYSISNWGRARGVGAPFLGAVVEHIRGELPHIVNFCTLSPMPAFRNWVSRVGSHILETVGIDMPSDIFKDAVQNAKSIAALKEAGVYEGLKSLAAFHVLGGTRAADGKLTPYDHIVAGFHQSRGAVAERLCPEANISSKGFEQSFGMMVNYANVGDSSAHAAAYRRGQPTIRPEIAAWLPPASPAKIQQTLWTMPQPA